MSKVLVTGGREYANKVALTLVLDELRPTCIVHGAADGADTLAHEYAAERTIKEIACPAPFLYLGPYAGMMRNIYMLDNHRPDIVVACPGGTGTANCVKNALLRGIPVRRVA